MYYNKRFNFPYLLPPTVEVVQCFKYNNTILAKIKNPSTNLSINATAVLCYYIGQFAGIYVILFYLLSVDF